MQNLVLVFSSHIFSYCYSADIAAMSAQCGTFHMAAGKV